MRKDKTDIDDDYEFARAKYYNLVEKGDEALELMICLLYTSPSPRD